MGKETDGNVQIEETKKKGKSIDDRLAAAKVKLQQLQALKHKKEAREKAKLNKAERAADTRRKVLLGALVLNRVARGDWTKDNLDDLTQELTRPDDRALFNLPPLDAHGPKQ
jgi:hypothetical protein